jgi:hypothetical protein
MRLVPSSNERRIDTANDPKGSIVESMRGQNRRFIRNAVQPVVTLAFDAIETTAELGAYGTGRVISIVHNTRDAGRRGLDGESLRKAA